MLSLLVYQAPRLTTFRPGLGVDSVTVSWDAELEAFCFSIFCSVDISSLLSRPSTSSCFAKDSTWLILSIKQSSFAFNTDSVDISTGSSFGPPSIDRISGGSHNVSGTSFFSSSGENIIDTIGNR